MPTKPYVNCPLCSLNQVMDKKSKGLVDYRKWDIKSEFIQIRDVAGGRGSGFPKVDSLTLHDAVLSGNPDYDQVLQRLKEQLLTVLDAFYKEGIITSADVKKVIP